MPDDIAQFLPMITSLMQAGTCFYQDGSTYMATSDDLETRGNPRRTVRREQGFAEEVFEILRADIMSCRIPPATRISIDKLARELNVSQTPIREALSQLEMMGLVTKQHYVGYCTAPQLTRRQFDELYEVRQLLEPYVARCAAERMDEETRAELAKIAGQMRPGTSRLSYDRFAEQDSVLHELIAAGSGNAIIQETLARLHSHFHIFRLGFHSEVTTEAMAEHQKIVTALLARDPNGAEQAMREHIERSYTRLASFTSAT